jgi:hypothetical protein
VEIIDRLVVPRRHGTEAAATIELLHGDLSAIPSEHAVDALVVSAFPNSYTPYPGTLFEDLFERGLDMREVAASKQEDQRDRLGCWISQPLPDGLSRRFNFRRIVCFEPRYPAFVTNTGFDGRNIEEVVGFVFRCLNNFAIPDLAEVHDARQFSLSRVAMPLLATGNQRVPVAALFPRLLEAAIFWLESGLPIEQLKIVTFSPAETAIAAPLFSAMARARRDGVATPSTALAADADDGWKADLARTVAEQVIDTCTRQLRQDLLGVASPDEQPIIDALFDRLRTRRLPLESAAEAPRVEPHDAPPEYDVFVSYAHKQEQEVQAFVQELQGRHPAVRIFYDRRAIPAGGLWIKRISDAVRKAHTFIAVLSPDYTSSPVCWDEFQCAKLKEYNTRTSVIRTVRLYSEPDLPPIMGIYSYVDCVEGDLAKLRASATRVLASG